MRMHRLFVSTGHILMAAKEAWQLGEARMLGESRHSTVPHPAFPYQYRADRPVEQLEVFGQATSAETLLSLQCCRESLAAGPGGVEPSAKGNGASHSSGHGRWDRESSGDATADCDGQRFGVETT